MKKALTFFVFTICILNLNAQNTISKVVSDFNSQVKNKDISKIKSEHFNVMIDVEDMEDIFDKPKFISIALSKMNGINDLKNVKITKIGSFSNLYEFFINRIINDTLGINENGEKVGETEAWDGKKKIKIISPLCFDCENSISVLKKNKSLLESIPSVDIYRIKYPFMDFAVYLNDKSWKIIINYNATKNIGDISDAKIIDKSINYLYKSQDN
jgi:hypothetical protein